MQLNDALEKLLEEFINFKSKNIGDGNYRKASYSSSEEMEQVFEEWVNEMVHSFVTQQDWEQIIAEHQDEP